MTQMTDTDVKMPYDKHDAQLVAKSLNTVTDTESVRMLDHAVKAGWISEAQKKDYMHDNLIRDYSLSDLDRMIDTINLQMRNIK